MNSLPGAFYESVFRVGWTVRDFIIPQLSITAQGLSGNIGTVAQQITSMYKYHAVAIRNNTIIGERRRDRNGDVPEHLWIEKDKFVANVDINIFESNKDKVSKEIIDRICLPNAVYSLVLQTGTMSKAWIDWACTAKRLTRLYIYKALDEEAIVLCKRLIETGHLAQLRVESEAYSEGVMEIMKLSLIQPQFESLRLVNHDHLEELLAFWSQNKETLRGKDLYFENPNHAHFFEDRLELRSQEEFDPISRHYFYFPRTLFGRPSHPYKLKYGRDDGDSHIAYMFFDCMQQKPNENEMSYCVKTPVIGILFT